MGKLSRTITRASSLALFALVCLWPAAAAALPGLQAGPLDWQFSGYLKTLGSMTQGASYYEPAGLTERETFWNNASRLRLRSNLFLGETLEFTTNYELFSSVGDDQRLRRLAEERFAGTPLGNLLLAQLFPTVAPPELMSLDHRIDENDEYRLDHRLDRLYLRLHAGPWDFTIGRQALSWGPGRLWNPTDYLASFSPTEIDKEEKRGVDLLHTRVAVSDRVSVEAFAAPVRLGENRLDGHGSAAAGQVSLHALDAEFALSGGWIYDRTKAGLSFNGLVFDAGLRGAVTRTTVEGVPNKAFYQAEINADYAWAVAWNPYLILEYFYNGFGETDPDKYADLTDDPAFVGAYQRGELYNVGRHYGGAILSLQPHALVALNETVIVNLSDTSLTNAFVLTWSVIQNFDVLFGAQNTFGPIPSEYGGATEPFTNQDIAVPDFYYAYLKYYF
jgi:hypothetical protein